MTTCVYCKYESSNEFETCPSCGESQEGVGESHTLIMAKPDIRIKPQKGWQSAELGDDYMLLLRIGDFEEVIKLPPDQEVILGRVEEDFHLDLTPYHATDRGVSRLHAAICQKAEMVQVKDLDSTNGTFLNGRQVGSYGWSIVRHNDELRLGQLSMTVHFDW